MDNDTYYAAVLKTLTDKMEALPWMNSKAPGERDIPHDPVTGTLYLNVNGVYLDTVAYKNSWSDPRWVTTDDIIKLGLKVKVNERPTVISRINKYNDYVSTSNLKSEYAALYNAQQIRNFPPYLSQDKAKYKETCKAFATTNFKAFKKSVKELMNNNRTMAPIAAYYVSIMTNTKYNAPVNKDAYLSAYKKIAEKKDALLKMMYSAVSFTKKAISPDFAIQDKSIEKRMTLQRKEYTQILSRNDRGLER